MEPRLYLVKWELNGLTHARTVVGEESRISLIAKIQEAGAAYVVVPA